MPTISVPSHLNDAPVAQLLTQIGRYFDSVDPISFDFSQLEFAQPFGALIAAEAIRRLKMYRHARGWVTNCSGEGILTAETQASGYLAHMGFFRHMGWDHGKAPGEASGNENYLPIRVLSSADLAADIETSDLHAAVEVQSRGLARMVFDEDYAQTLLSYCFAEIVRNVFEHANTDSCCIMAQKYSKTVVEIAVVDAGRGIHSSITEAYPGLSRPQALAKAIRPGSSRTRSLGPQGNLVNAGFGLFVLSELGRCNGELKVWSDDHLLTVSPTGETVSPLFGLSGTCVKIRVATAQASAFPTWLFDLVERTEHQLPDDAVRTRGPSKGKA